MEGKDRKARRYQQSFVKFRIDQNVIFRNSENMILEEDKTSYWQQSMRRCTFQRAVEKDTQLAGDREVC
jgi:hypothetical protein